MNDTPTPTPRTDEWEAYCDECYYHFWRLRRKTERGWYDGFHTHTGEEAKGLCDLLNNLEAELTAVTEQRDSLHELHNKNAARSKELLELCGTLREQRDRLAEALRKIQKVGLVAVDAFDELDRIDEIVDEALAAVKGDNHES